MLLLPLCLFRKKPSKSFIISIVLTTIANVVVLFDFSLAMDPKANVNSATHTYKIATFNVASGRVNAAAIIAWYQNEDLDALLLQESTPAALNQQLPANLTLDCHGNLCLLSQHDFQVVRYLDRRALQGWGHYAAHYLLTLDEVEVDLVNLHLNTPRHGFELLHAPLSNYSAITRAYKNQVFESMVTSELISVDQGLSMIGGDFNLTQKSRIYQQYWSEWSNAFNKVGFGIGYTKNSRLFGSRIDHILTGSKIRPIHAEVQQALGSDHKPVILEFAFK
ncbi:endonuclease/exonuclease/phosphatase family protein [Rheinheimera sp. UJ51]|uniref:endonuclease/exonuclease/phosphatase family protein n=1 Tax=Rheinheimera sp. UJ51 TaxID=2892446 RepID=UPI001E2D6082|nr:endonuclease/exonuclease/phosphatase family protein [Rheinheimera sp. UJ51]MCC5451116.1 endonuclease/exonuclease/phosphatase family protein [Rheinheimera sp. UJ51]